MAMRNTLSRATLAVALALAAGLALAEGEAGHGAHGGMSGMDMTSPGAMAGYMGAMDSMMEAMPGASSGDPDADFLLMMIPHHQSAIDMARVELERGDDPATRALAQAIIDAQEKEIADMRAMLEAMGVTPPAAE